MEKYKKILDSVIKEIKPTTKEKKIIVRAIKKLKSLMKSKLKKINAEFFLGGSFAKNTIIKKDKYDIDIFVLFNYDKYKNKSEKLSDYLEKILKNLRLKYEKLKGSRDYFSMKFEESGVKIFFEIIPILKIYKAEKAKNITDVSPLHVTYIKRILKTKKELANDIRLTKAFCYSQECYGAESYIRGFSGYSLEILTCYYGSFLNLLKASKKWREKEIIDPQKHYKNKREILVKMNKEKLSSPIVLIDPVQKDRNITAALSKEKLNLFVKAARSFLLKPSKDFFIKKKINVIELIKKAKKKRAKLAILEIKTKQKREDVMYSKALKFLEFFIFNLKNNGFSILEERKEFGKEVLAYLLYRNPRKNFIVSGPPLKMGKNFQDFVKKYKCTFIKNKRVYAKLKRKILKIEDFFQFFKNKEEKTIKEMSIKKISLVKIY